MTTDRGLALGLRPAALLSAGVLALVLVAFIAHHDVVDGVTVGAIFSGSLAIAIAIGTGSVVASAARRRPPASRLSLRLLGSAMALWGVGQLVVGDPPRPAGPVLRPHRRPRRFQGGQRRPRAPAG